MVSEPQDLMAQRYGIRMPSESHKRRVRWLAIFGVAVFTTLVAVFSLITYNPISHKDVGYSVESEQRIWVEFEVTAPVGSAVRCDVQALNNQFAVVGFKTVKFAGARQEVSKYSVSLNTTELAVTGLVDKCELD
jgi:hypothetical protein